MQTKWASWAFVQGKALPQRRDCPKRVVRKDEPAPALGAEDLEGETPCNTPPAKAARRKAFQTSLGKQVLR